MGREICQHKCNSGNCFKNLVNANFSNKKASKYRIFDIIMSTMRNSNGTIDACFQNSSILSIMEVKKCRHPEF